MRYALLRKSGWLASRQPRSTWAEATTSLWPKTALADPETMAVRLLHGNQHFLFTPDFAERARDQWRQFDTECDAPSQQAERIAAGEFSLFHVQDRSLGLPPDWHTNALTGEQTPRDWHWSRIGDFDYGDIKVIWDLNRFHFAFSLSRAYARTGDERWPELFWLLVEDWQENNPPNQGTNWKCGQEASLRAMAWCFALFAMARSSHTTADRVASLARALAFTGKRIAGNIGYAVSQKNNHGVSEATGLLTIATLLPELKQAGAWRELSRRILARLARELIYDDGGFSQHSWNYHRLMLHDYVWAIRLAEVNGQPLAAETVDRVRRAGELLYQVTDLDTGGVPCYGQDDGSLILPLNNCSYFDYRPAVQATAAVTTGQRILPDGPWDEDLLWLFNAEALYPQMKLPRSSAFRAPASGYVVLRSEAGFAACRGATFRHRPAQADMLHVDVWWRGENIAVDAGTLTYNALPPWDNPLATAAYHNTVTVDDCDQMTRAGRFVWLPWLTSKSIMPMEGNNEQIAYWQAEHDGYKRLRPPVHHQRAVVRLPCEHWLILDNLASPAPHQYRLHWLFPDCPFAWQDESALLTLSTRVGEYHARAGALGQVPAISLVRGDEATPRGWRARGYQRRQPAISLAAQLQTASVTFWTLLGPQSLALAPADRTNDDLVITADDWEAGIALNSRSASQFVRSINVSGSHEDVLNLSA